MRLLNGLPSNTDSQTSQPQFEDGSTYHPLRPTKLDKTENFHAPVHLGAVTGAGLAR